MPQKNKGKLWTSANTLPTITIRKLLTAEEKPVKWNPHKTLKSQNKKKFLLTMEIVVFLKYKYSLNIIFKKYVL